MIFTKSAELSQHKLNAYGGVLTRLEDKSRGRKYPLDGDNLSFYVNPWQLDKTRILQSKALCRMPGKMQVHTLPLNPHIHNRMTHTADVVVIALQIAGILKLNTDYQETISWAHDLGHTPYGHNGEKVLGIDHARNGVVVLQETENYGAGLNLSWEVANAIVKHSLGKRELYRDQPEEINALILADRIAYVFSDIEDIYLFSLGNGEAQNNYCACELMENGLLDNLPEEIGQLGAGRNAKRQRINACISAIAKESFEKETVSFSESDTAKKFKTIRDWMYKNLYHKLDQMEDRKYQRENLKAVLEYFEENDLCGNMQSNFVVSLLTDKEVNWLADNLREDPRKIDIEQVKHLSALEIVKTLGNKEIDHQKDPLW